jgi:hypothetical protein
MSYATRIAKTRDQRILLKSTMKEQWALHHKPSILFVKNTDRSLLGMELVPCACDNSFACGMSQRDCVKYQCYPGVQLIRVDPFKKDLSGDWEKQFHQCYRKAHVCAVLLFQQTKNTMLRDF